jgi:tetratricopeptide (TPR) repeat protein
MRRVMVNVCVVAAANVIAAFAISFSPASAFVQTTSLDRAAWIGVKVMPKPNAEAKVGNVVVDMKRSSLPWRVQDVNGEWLYVGDQDKGWVRRRQDVTLDEASAYYTSLINRGVQKAWAYGKRAAMWSEKGELDLAISDYGEALRHRPDALTYNNRGVTWQAKKEYNKAIADYNRAIRLGPTAGRYNNRGKVWREMKEYDKAIADYQHALDLDPRFASAYNSSAWLRSTCADARYRDGARAVANATKACELTGWTVHSCVSTLGAAYAERGEFDAAIKYQQKAIDLNPNDADFVKAANELIALYRQQKPYRE